MKKTKKKTAAKKKAAKRTLPDSLVAARASGGYLTHYRKLGAKRALCDYEPGPKVKTGRVLARRDGWTREAGSLLCGRCKSVASLLTSGARVVSER